MHVSGDHREHCNPFTEKVAVMKEYQFDGDRNGAQWRMSIRIYLISKAPEIAAVLKTVEDNEDARATVSDLATRSLGVPHDRIRSMAADLWAFLALNLQGSARLWVNNSEPMEGSDL